MGRVIGNEIFKDIIQMAYEMELARKVLNRMSRRRDKVLNRMGMGQTFRDDEDIRKEITKYLAISPDNKKHWRFDEPAENGENGFVLIKEIPISVSGPYRVMLSIVKHTEYEVARDRDFYNKIYVHLRDSVDEDVNEYENAYFIAIPPTTTTVELLKQIALRMEFKSIKEAYNEMYERLPWSTGATHAKIWNKRISMMRADDQSGALFKKIRLRYGVRAIEDMTV